MKKVLLQYNIVIEKEQQKKGKDLYVAHVPTLGISDFGKTPDLAAKNIESAIKIYLETLHELGKPIPHPDGDEVYVTSRKIVLDSPINSFSFS